MLHQRQASVPRNKMGTKSDAEKFEKELPLVLNQCGQLAGFPPRPGTAFPRLTSSWTEIMLSQQFVMHCWHAVSARV